MKAKVSPRSIDSGLRRQRRVDRVETSEHSAAPARPASRNWPKRLAISGLVFVSLLVAANWYWRSLFWNGNLHPVIAGQAFRAAQPAPEQLEQLASELQLRSVLSLRGGKQEWDWFEAEQQICKQRGLELHSVHLHPDRMPSRQALRALLDILENAPRPILLHCRQGIDRTGLASAALLLLDERSPDVAADQFGLRYGFVPGMSGSELPRVIVDYADWLHDSGREHSKSAFRHWVEHIYVAHFYRAKLELAAGDRHVPLGVPVRWRIRATNLSPEPWQFRSLPDRGVHLGMLVTDPESQRKPGGEGTTRSALIDRRVEPGGFLECDAELPPFTRPGAYRVAVDLVDESVIWFADMGSELLIVDVVADSTK